MQYPKGIETKKNILTIAKQLLYENGYKKTTIQMIASKAHVPIGLVNYYFKKNEFIDTIYLDFYKNVSGFVSEHAGEQMQNSLQEHIVIHQLMMTHFHSDPKLLSFLLEISHAGLLPQSVAERMHKRQLDFIKSMHLDTTAQYNQWCLLAEQGACIELLEQNTQIKAEDPEFQDLLAITATIAVRLAGVTPRTINKNLTIAHQVIAELPTLDYHILL
ncbi:MAG: TetR/AcrR family transcriptional regulator [Lachnospiraceae bacterium]